MKKNLPFLIFVFLLGFSTAVFSKTITLTPVGSGNDDGTQIQNALNTMVSGDIILLNGSFTLKKTIFLPAGITWKLTGTLTLADGSYTYVGWKGTVSGVSVDATRPTAIAEKDWSTTSTKSGIDFSGGTYNGNYIRNNNTNKTRIRMINFVRVINSKFHDFTIKKASDDNFTLGPGCTGNEIKWVNSSYAGIAAGTESGNALTDKGSYNKWYDCRAEYCTSDGVTPKCHHSEFTRVIAKGNTGPGWGMYCRLDGCASDIGTSIDYNKFYDCEAYDSGGSGFSFNISETTGTGGTIRNNFIQAKCYNNNESGVRFRNKISSGKIENNQIDIWCYGNKGKNGSGVVQAVHGGLGTEKSAGTLTGITGSIIAYGNGNADVNVANATGCNITVYRPSGEAAPILKAGSGNTLNTVNYTCPAGTAWCQIKYCNGSSASLPYTSPDKTVTKGSLNWTSGLINISGASSVVLSMALEGSTPATLESDDYCNVYYKVNGGAQQTLSANTDGFAKKTVSKTGITGNTLEIIIQALNSALDETYKITAISVTGSALKAAAKATTESPDAKQNSEAFTMYPNPVSTNGILTIDARNQDVMVVRIISTNGQLVYSKNFNGAKALNIETSNLMQSGLYIVSVISKDGVVNKKLIVK